MFSEDEGMWRVTLGKGAIANERRVSVSLGAVKRMNADVWPLSGRFRFLAGRSETRPLLLIRVVTAVRTKPSPTQRHYARYNQGGCLR